MRRDYIPIAMFIAGTALGVTLLAPLTWAVLLAEGLLVPAVLGAAAGWGAWPTVGLGFRDRSPARQFCIATALGLGLLSVFTLAFGVAGLLSRPVAWGFVAAGGAVGLLRLYLLQPKQRGPHNENAAQSATQAQPATRPTNTVLAVRTLLLLALAAPLAITLFGAALPPGTLWQGEANAYDVLEYHLEAPREYYNAGRITFLPHNVYASFPQQMEMLYLLLMHLAGDVYAAAIPAQLLHAACGILAVIALASAARPGWGRWLVALLAGSTPWLAYLGCLAYVENGMLFFAAVAVGVLIDQERANATGEWRTILTAGLCAGLAGGCKYTALMFVALALGLAWLITTRASLGSRVRRIGIFGIGVLLAFSPWLVRNGAFTGNPVYPFAYRWFGGKAWSEDQARQWTAGHRVRAEHDSLAGRLGLAVHELFGSVQQRARVTSGRMMLTRYEIQPSLFGQVLFVLALVGACVGRSRRAALLGTWAVLIVLGWVWLTFIPGRFAVPLIVPLALLGGECLAADGPTGSFRGRSWLRWPVLLLALTGALINDVSLAGKLREHRDYWKRDANALLSSLVGQTTVLVEGHALTQELDADAYAWLVGEAAVFYIDRQIHYTVPFSRDPWLEFAATADASQCLDWLRDRHVSHVVFSWSEIERLRRTYGFSGIVTHDWVARLKQAGLRRVKMEPSAFGDTNVEIYELPAAPSH
jgi:hypothetical protein